MKSAQRLRQLAFRDGLFGGSMQRRVDLQTFVTQTLRCFGIGGLLLLAGCWSNPFESNPPVVPMPQSAGSSSLQTDAATRVAYLAQTKRHLHPGLEPDVGSAEAAVAADGRRPTARLEPSTPTRPARLRQPISPATATGISVPAQAFVLQRQPDCSLSLLAGNYNLDWSKPTLNFQNIVTTANFERTLHSAAQLTSTADSFPAGCAAATGTGSTIAAYLGKTAQNLALFAGPGSDPATGANALFSLNVDAGTGNVTRFAVDAAEPNIVRIASGDLDGDGLSDIVGLDHLTSSASLSVRMTHSDGTIGAATIYPLPGSAGEAAVVDDFNGDGKADVAVVTIDANSGQETLSLLTGNGDGSLNKAVSTSIATPSALTSNFPGSVLAPVANLISADLRGSGHRDLIASNGVVLLNKGDGSFATAATPAFPPRTATSSLGPHLAAGDFNLDGKIDLVVSNGAELDIYLGRADGTFATGNSYASNGSTGFVSVADLDGDGNPDLYVGVAGGGVFGGDPFDFADAYALMGNGDGSFRGAPLAPAAFTGQNMADLNGDKKPDLVGLSGATFTTYIGRGDGSYVTGATLNASSFSTGGVTYSSAAVVGYTLTDVNGDGYPDLVWITNSVDNSTARTFFFVALNKHDGSFGAPSVNEFPSLVSGSDFETYFAAGSIQAADFNHDGKADLLVSFSEITYEGKAYQFGYFVLPGKGNGTFGTPADAGYGNRAIEFIQPATAAVCGDRDRRCERRWFSRPAHAADARHRQPSGRRLRFAARALHRQGRWDFRHCESDQRRTESVRRTRTRRGRRHERRRTSRHRVPRPGRRGRQWTSRDLARQRRRQLRRANGLRFAGAGHHLRRNCGRGLRRRRQARRRADQFRGAWRRAVRQRGWYARHSQRRRQRQRLANPNLHHCRRRHDRRDRYQRRRPWPTSFRATSSCSARRVLQAAWAPATSISTSTA